jgi:hypothetical protein
MIRPQTSGRCDEEPMPTDELDEEFDEELAPDLDEEEIDEDALADEDLEEGEFAEESLEEEGLEEEEEEGADADAAATPVKRKKAAEEDDDEEELDPDDVEADLDTILKDRIAAADDLEDEEDEEEEEDYSGESTGRVQPKTDSEFVCKSCFLVKRVSQRVPGTDDLCSDCV